MEFVVYLGCGHCGYSRAVGCRRRSLAGACPQLLQMSVRDPLVAVVVCPVRPRRARRLQNTEGRGVGRCERRRCMCWRRWYYHV